MKRKLALVALLVSLGYDMFSQAFVKKLPVLMDSVTFSVESFQDNGLFFSSVRGTFAVPSRCFKSLELCLEVDTAYIGEVLLEPIGPKDSHMYSFTGYLYKGKFNTCLGVREMTMMDQGLSITTAGEAQMFYVVRVRQAPAPFR